MRARSDYPFRGRDAKVNENHLGQDTKAADVRYMIFSFRVDFEVPVLHLVVDIRFPEAGSRATSNPLDTVDNPLLSTHV